MTNNANTASEFETFERRMERWAAEGVSEKTIAYTRRVHERNSKLDADGRLRRRVK